MNCVPLSELAVSRGWQANFLAVLPAVRTHARFQFRRLKPERREEAVQEAIASACVSYQLLAVQGKLHSVRPSALADFAVKHVRSGRHVGGHQSSADVHSELAQQKHGLRVRSLPPWQDEQQPWRALLVESRRVSPPDLAAFRLDFEDWLRGFPRRDRKIITVLASGEGTLAVADRFGLSAARVSQLRRRYEHDWRVFQGEAEAMAKAS